MLDKLRPTVIILAMILAILAGMVAYFAFVWMISVLHDPSATKYDVVPPVALLFSVVSGCVAAIGTALGIVAQDAPPPVVPASTHESIVNKILDGEEVR